MGGQLFTTDFHPVEYNFVILRGEQNYHRYRSQRILGMDKKATIIQMTHLITSRKGQMMSKQENLQQSANLTPSQQTMLEIWEEHMKAEFVMHNTEDTLDTMVDDPYVINVPAMLGGVGRDGVREYYSKHFIPRIPPDMEMTSISRTIGNDRIVDEMILKFTHTIEMDWMLPDIPPTGKRVELPLVAVIHFREGKIASEHIYWDQASVLAQLGLIDAGALPVAGVENTRKLLDLAVGHAD